MPLDADKPSPPSSPSFLAALSARHVANAIVALIFATTGPIAIMLAVAAKGGLSEPQIASWIFGGFFVNGLVSLAFSLYFRQPLVMLWSIPGVVLVGPALATYSFPQVVGAYLGCGLLMLVLGLTGWVRRAMQSVPMPIVMGMVAGVFLKFALDWIAALSSSFAIAGPMTLVYFALLTVPALARRAPPLIVALMVGLVAASANGLFQPDLASATFVAKPILVWPDFSLAAMIELVVPFTIAVLVVQNGQGMAVLQAAGHAAPLNAIAVACGAASLVSGLTGAVNTCLTGPLSAILTDSPDRENHYSAAVVASILLTLFGVFAPLVHAASPGVPDGRDRHARRPRHAEGSGERVRNGLSRQAYARRARHIPGDDLWHHHRQYRRAVLGAGVRLLRVAIDRARAF